MAELWTLSFTDAGTYESDWIEALGELDALSLQAAFTYVAATATSAKFYVQSSLDGGGTVFDIASFAFTTASLTKVASVNGTATLTPTAIAAHSLADNTVQNGALGDRIRVVGVIVGTYGAGSQIALTYQPH